jgi:hypothetical protein
MQHRRTPAQGAGRRRRHTSVLIFAHPDAAKELDAAESLADELEANHPDAAASLGEGFKDVFTVRRSASAAS